VRLFPILDAIPELTLYVGQKNRHYGRTVRHVLGQQKRHERSRPALLRSNYLPGATLRTPLDGQVGEKLLARLQRGHVLVCGALGVHGEKEGPNDDFNHAGGDILNDLGALLVCEFLDFGAVRLDFR
jgi:hypothetical protein